MTEVALGSVWSVPRLGGKVLVILGPFGSPDRPEFLATPLYATSHPGFARSRIDVEISPAESPFDETTFAAVWNARPLLATELGLNHGVVATPALDAVKDVYWATLNERPLKGDRRLGRFQFLRRQRILKFQHQELERWDAASKQVWEVGAQATSSPKEAAHSQEVSEQRYWGAMYDFVTATISEGTDRECAGTVPLDRLRIVTQIKDDILRWTGEFEIPPHLHVSIVRETPGQDYQAYFRSSVSWLTCESTHIVLSLSRRHPSPPVPTRVLEAAEVS